VVLQAVSGVVASLTVGCYECLPALLPAVGGVATSGCRRRYQSLVALLQVATIRCRHCGEPKSRVLRAVIPSVGGVAVSPGVECFKKLPAPRHLHIRRCCYKHPPPMLRAPTADASSVHRRCYKPKLRFHVRPVDTALARAGRRSGPKLCAQ
jgi:hypothetical protein